MNRRELLAGAGLLAGASQAKAFGLLGAEMGRLGAVGGGGNSEAPPTFSFTKATGLFGTQTVASGGSGHSNGDLITLSGGTFDAPAVLQVTGVSGGVITDVVIVTPGSYTVAPSNPVTGGDATFTCAFAVFAASTIPNGTSFNQNNAAFRWNAVEPRQNIGSSGYFGNADPYLGTGATIEFSTRKRAT